MTARVNSVGILYSNDRLQEAHIGLDTRLTFDGSPLEYIVVRENDQGDVPNRGRAFLRNPSGDHSVVDVNLTWL